MTLILTEISQAGIAMATDSAISFMINDKVVGKDRPNWKKLFWNSKVKAGISYWGAVGLITKIRFDEWLQDRLAKGQYTDLPSLADYLAEEMNRAVGGKPLRQPNHQVGIHVAGYRTWGDGVLRPTLYHVHNGDSYLTYPQKTTTAAGRTIILETTPVWKNSPRKLFARHDDFAPENPAAPDQIIFLDSGGIAITRNGNYAVFHLISDALGTAFMTLNTIPGVSVPRKNKNRTALSARVGLLKMVMEFTIDIYRCSSLQEVIGGEVSTLGIASDRHYIG